jgi:hypothetical protein
MKTLSLASFALILSAVPGAALAGNDSAQTAGASIAAMAEASAAAPGMTPPPMPMPRPMPPMGGGRNWGGQHQGRWIGGWRAPGGWGAYRRPAVGYVLPRYWINPSFYVGNYGQYGFSRPAMGYGWSRYYDDAVLTDRYGRVADSVYGYNWGQYDRYDDGGAGYGPQTGNGPGYDPGPGYGRPRDRDGGLGGAVIGGVAGALGGAAIAGRGDRAEGAIIGGVIGAVAGTVIDRSDNAGRGYGNGYGRPEGMSRHEWKRWRKAHSGGGYGYPGYGYGQQGGGYGYQGGGYQGGSYGGGGCGVQQGGAAGGPGDGGHWSQNGSAAGGPIIVSGGGWGYACVTTITVQQPAPVTTTTTTVTERVVYQRVAARHRVFYRKPVRHFRPRCQCRTAAPVLQGS